MSVNLGSCIPLCPQVSGSKLRLLFLYGTRYARILAPGFPLDSGTNLRSTARAVGRHSRKSLTSLTRCLLTRGFTFPHSNSPLVGGILGDGQRAWPASMGRQVCRVSEVFVSTTALQEKRLILVLGSELSVFAVGFKIHCEAERHGSRDTLHLSAVSKQNEPKRKRPGFHSSQRRTPPDPLPPRGPHFLPSLPPNDHCPIVRCESNPRIVRDS